MSWVERVGSNLRIAILERSRVNVDVHFLKEEGKLLQSYEAAPCPVDHLESLAELCSDMGRVR